MGQVQEDCGRKSNFNYPVLGGGLFDIEKQQHLFSLKTEFHERSCLGTVLCGRAKIRKQQKHLRSYGRGNVWDQQEYSPRTRQLACPTASTHHTNKILLIHCSYGLVNTRRTEERLHIYCVLFSVSSSLILTHFFSDSSEISKATTHGCLLTGFLYV